MRRLQQESGFTLIELLVVIAMLAIVSIGFYSVMGSGLRSSDRTQAVAQVSQEARLGFNRMVRDTREGDWLADLSATSFNVKVNFDGVGGYENTNPQGDYEDLTFAYNAGAGTITLNGAVLMRGVEKINSATDVFSYTSNRLEYDANGDGVTTLTELQNSGTLTSTEAINLVSSVVFNLRVGKSTTTTDFYAEAQLRNKR